MKGKFIWLIIGAVVLILSAFAIADVWGSNRSFVLTSLTNSLVPIDNGITTLNAQVYNQTWLDFNATNETYTLIDSSLEDSITFWYKNLTSDWTFLSTTLNTPSSVSFSVIQDGLPSSYTTGSYYDSLRIRIYSYKNISGTLLFSPTYLDSNTKRVYAGDCLLGFTTEKWNWSWTPVSGADGYRILPDYFYTAVIENPYFPGDCAISDFIQPFGGSYDYYYDVSTPYFIDNDTSLFSSGEVHTPNAYVNNGTGNLTQYPAYHNGTHFFLGKTDATTFFNGSVDDFRVYNTSLSSDEVLNIYQEGRQ